MNKKIQLLLLTTIIALASGLALPQTAQAHCQVPCGIYDDYSRLLIMLEDGATVEKAGRLISELASKQDAQSQNQLVRWVNTKEQHAQNVIQTISDYFLTQRVKPAQKDYSQRLQKHHAVIIAAMKAKQNADPIYGEKLSKSIQALAAYYPEHKH